MSTVDLNYVAALAYLYVEPNEHNQLTEDLTAMLNLANKLRSLDTAGVAPLLHPLDIPQRFRKDVVHHEDHVVDLAKIAPDFSDQVYWVPKVIDTGK